MKRGRIALIPLIFFLISCSSQIGHITVDQGVKCGHTPTDEMTNRIVELAAKYESYAQFSRIALFDMAFGSNPEEYKKLGG